MQSAEGKVRKIKQIYYLLERILFPKKYNNKLFWESIKYEIFDKVRKIQHYYLLERILFPKDNNNKLFGESIKSGLATQRLLTWERSKTGFIKFSDNNSLTF